MKKATKVPIVPIPPAHVERHTKREKGEYPVTLDPAKLCECGRAEILTEGMCELCFWEAP